MDVASHRSGCAPCTTRSFISKARYNLGFTLIEMMVALAILAVLAGYALPAFSTLISKQRQVSSVNSLISTLYLARSEAIMRNREITICKSVNGVSCSRSGEWNQGWVVFDDSNRDREIDSDEDIIAIHPSVTHFTIYYRAFGSNHYLIYRATGMTETNGTYTFCSSNNSTSPHAVIVFKTGRPRSSPIRSDGRPLKCPP